MRPTLTHGRLSEMQIIEGKTKHGLQTLSRRCLFLRATSGTEHKLVCEECHVAVCVCVALNERTEVMRVPGTQPTMVWIWVVVGPPAS